MNASSYAWALVAAADPADVSPSYSGQRFNLQIAEFHRFAFRLQSDGAGTDGCAGDFILQHAIDAHSHGVAAANDVVGIPFSKRFLGTWLLVWNKMALGRRTVCLGATIAADFARIAGKQLRLKAGWPDPVSAGDVQKNAAVAGTGRKTPLHVQPVVAISLQRPRVTFRSALAQDNAIGHRPDGCGGYVCVLGYKRPTRKVLAVEQLNLPCWCNGGLIGLCG